MNRRFFFLIMLTCFASVAWGQDTNYPFVGTIEHGLSDPATIMTLPDGSGPALTEARQVGGAVVDATIRVRLINEYLDPIVNFPEEDLWLQFDRGVGTATGCNHDSGYPGGFFTADGVTDWDGWTAFTLPLRGGGWSELSVHVYLLGSMAIDPNFIEFPPLPLGLVSPDINGDLVINLTDIALFSQDLLAPGGGHLRSDFNNDGEINLTDIALFAQGLGSTCE